MINKKDLSKIGIGTWGIGGFIEADPQNDDEGQIDAIVYALNKGINYVETVYMYAKGKAVDLLSKAIKKSGVDREKIFITLSVYQSDAKTIDEVEKRLDWIVSKGFLPLNKSSSKEHIDENLAAFSFEVTKEDLDRLNGFKIPNYESPKIDWLDTGDGVKIHQLSNVFDEIYKG